MVIKTFKKAAAKSIDDKLIEISIFLWDIFINKGYEAVKQVVSEGSDDLKQIVVFDDVNRRVICTYGDFVSIIHE